MSEKPWMATILTTSDGLPTREELFREMNAIPGYETVDFEWVAEELDKIVFRTPAATLAISLPVEEIVPKTDLQNACRRAWHWAEAALEVQKDTRQLVVAVMPNGNTLDQIDVALLLTCLTIAVLKNTNGVAVYWNHSGMLHAPQEFVAHAQGMNRRTLPVELWVDFRIIPNTDGTISLGTWGLETFALSELEVSRSQQDVRWMLRWMFNLSHFLLENGPILEDGHTFGPSEEEKFTLTFTSSAPEMLREGNRQVIRIHFEPIPDATTPGSF